MFDRLNQLFGRRPRPVRQAEIVTFDDERVTRTMTDGRVEQVRWADLREIVIVTTNEGPFVEDVFWTAG